MTRWTVVLLAAVVGACGGGDDGTCPDACPAGEACFYGVCLPEGDVGGDDAAEAADDDCDDAGEQLDELEGGDVEAEAPDCGPRLLPCDGRCEDPVDDPENCGACGTVCPMYSDCVLGECICLRDGEVLCDGACVELGTNENCSACGDACVDLWVCVAGACRCSEALCGALNCTDLDTDHANCGTCGNDCADLILGMVCVDGECECPPGTVLMCRTGPGCWCEPVEKG